MLGPRAKDDDLVAGDGKELRHSQGVEIVSLYAVKSGRWLGSERVAQDSNEIPAIQAVLRSPSVDLEGALVVTDALNTQTETARIIVQEKGADYLLTVKGNQKGVAENVRQLQQGLQHAFSPSARGAHGPKGGTQLRTHGGPLSHSFWCHGRASLLSRRGASRPFNPLY